MKLTSAILTLLFLTQICSGQIVKDGIAKSVGDSIEQYIGRGEVTFLQEIFNKKKFLSYILLQEDNNAHLDAFNRGFGSTDYISGFAGGLTENIKAGNEYTFINYSTDKDDNYYLRFRQFGDDGINYHDYFLEF